LTDIYLGIDQGSGSSKAILINKEGKTLFFDSISISSSFPSLEKVEQDGEEILESILELVIRAKTFSRKSNLRILSMGFSCQRSGVIAWEKSGHSVSKLISWRDARNKLAIQKLAINEKEIFELSGLPLTYHYAALKISKFQDEFKDNKIFIGTLDSFVLYNLLSDHPFITEESHACRSQLYGINTNDWHNRLISIFSVDQKRLAKIVPSFYDFGLIQDLPLRFVVGDQQAALISYRSLETPILNIGTVASIVIDTKESVTCHNGYLSALTYSSQSSQRNYQLEASINSFGITIDLLRKRKIIKDLSDFNKFLKPVSDSAVAFFPFQSGNSPDWKNDLGNFFDRDFIDDTELSRALIENISNTIAFNLDNLINLGVLNSNKKEILALGGGSEINYLLTFLASVSGFTVKCMKESQGSALGAALGSIKLPPSTIQLLPIEIDRTITPDKNIFSSDRYKKWQNMRKLILKGDVNDYRRFNPET